MYCFRVKLRGTVIASVFFLPNWLRFRWIIRNLGTRHSCTVFSDFFEDLWQLSQ
jgi:hypothetical protein